MATHWNGGGYVAGTLPLATSLAELWENSAPHGSYRSVLTGKG
jgi:hypothetical protein